MESFQQFAEINWLNLLAISCFLLCFKGYIYYARKRAYDTVCLASVMHMYRYEWMLHMLARDVRVADTTAIANLERSVAFFASTTMLILAGLMTVVGSTEKVIDVVSHIPFAMPATQQEWELKLLLMIGLFVYAFFKFTWSLRQYGFVSVMVGGAPMPSEHISEKLVKSHAKRIALMSSLAANNFNAGLRTYYFAIAVLGWFISPWIFIFMTFGVVYILYRREFKSSTLRNLTISVGEEL